MFVFVDSSIAVVLGTVIVCDPVFVAFLETLPFSDVDVHILGVVEDETPIVTLDELKTLVAVVNCCVVEVTGTLVIGNPVCVGELLSTMLPVFVVSDDKAVTLLIGAAVLVCPFPDVT